MSGRKYPNVWGQGRDELNLQKDSKDVPGTLGVYDGIIHKDELRPSKIPLVDFIKRDYQIALMDGNYELAFSKLVELYDLFEGIQPPGSEKLKKDTERIIRIFLKLIQKQHKFNRENGTRDQALDYRDIRMLNRRINLFLNKYLSYMSKKNYDIRTESSIISSSKPEGLDEEMEELFKDQEGLDETDIYDKNEDDSLDNLNESEEDKHRYNDLEDNTPHADPVEGEGATQPEDVAQEEDLPIQSPSLPTNKKELAPSPSHQPVPKPRRTHVAPPTAAVKLEDRLGDKDKLELLKKRIEQQIEEKELRGKDIRIEITKEEKKEKEKPKDFFNQKITDVADKEGGEEDTS